MKLMDVVMRLAERKTSAGAESEIGRVVHDDELLLLPFADLDLPIEELPEVRAAINYVAEQAVTELDATLDQIAFGLWLDGFATGIMYERERATEEARV